jgi:hypothetical protein
VTKILPGYALVRLDDLAALLAAGSPRPTGPAAEQPPEPDGATWQALGTAVGILTARIHSTGTSHGDILGDTPPGPVIAALAVIAAAVLVTALPPGRAGALLEDLGLAAADETGQQLRRMLREETPCTPEEEKHDPRRPPLRRSLQDHRRRDAPRDNHARHCLG